MFKNAFSNTCYLLSTFYDSYSAIKRKKLLICGTTLINLKIITPSEDSQNTPHTQKGVCVV